MTIKIKILLILLLIILIPASTAWSEENTKLTIFHTNDCLGYIKPCGG